MENILAKNAQVKCFVFFKFSNLFVIIVCVHLDVWLHMLHVALRGRLCGVGSHLTRVGSNAGPQACVTSVFNHVAILLSPPIF